ncbi:MAG: hypothetical protein EOO91_06730, partial [Pedobacter sp.]
MFSLPKYLNKKSTLLVFALFISAMPLFAQNTKVISAKKINETSIELLLSDNQKRILDFYGENIFRMFQDNVGGTLRDPEAKPEAKILVENPRRPVTSLNIVDANNQ